MRALLFSLLVVQLLACSDDTDKTRTTDAVDCRLTLAEGCADVFAEECRGPRTLSSALTLEGSSCGATVVVTECDDDVRALTIGGSLGGTIRHYQGDELIGVSSYTDLIDEGTCGLLAAGEMPASILPANNSSCRSCRLCGLQELFHELLDACGPDYAQAQLDHCLSSAHPPDGISVQCACESCHPEFNTEFGDRPARDAFFDECAIEHCQNIDAGTEDDAGH
jgi:hypothetical protein